MSVRGWGDELMTVDLGTQSLRLAAYDDAGRRRWAWSAPVDSHINGDVYEQSPEQWESLLLQGLGEAQRAGVKPSAIAAAGTLAGYVALGSDGRSLGAATMYPDRRATEQASRVAAMLSTAGNDHGLRVHAADPLPQWMDFVMRSPETARRTSHFLDSTGWLNHLLCGESSLNAFTGLRLYDAALREALSVDNAPFGRIIDVGQDVGELRPSLVTRFGFGRVRVISAAFDSKSAYLGAGLSAPGEAADISGTVSSFGVLWPRRINDPERRIYSVPFVGQHLVRGSTAAAGSSLEWMCRSLLREDPVALEQLATQAPPGANGLTFLPYLSGERSPLWNPWASGAMLGLRLSSNPADFARAVFEGLAFSVGHIADVMRESGVELQSVRLAGGLARSSLLGQIKADVLGVPVAPFVDHELTSQGLAAILAVATGQAANLVEASRRFTAVERWVEPQEQTRAAHRTAYERYRAASAWLEPSFVSAVDRPES
jgi:xylulokinase